MAPAMIQELEDETEVTRPIELNPVESTLQRLLLDVAKFTDESTSSSNVDSQVSLSPELAEQALVLRFTGGWVRDKLLGVQSHDIDVAINKMTGYQFGLRMKEYLEIPGNLEKYGLEAIAANDKQSQKAGATNKSKLVGGLHKIEANPEKSKHLETTTMRILGLDIDLVNLRKETYTDNSRNPQIEFGTPEEDALRRDATVNAMFYNLDTQQVEDLTERGHEDMRKKIIRTPLEPFQTFKDDPLRVLRLIRFAGRLGYTIDSKALVAMRNSEIKDALRRKISRERIGTEVEKSLQGPDPHESLRLIFSLGLYETIFLDPTEDGTHHYEPDTDGWEVVIGTLSNILEASGTIAEHLLRDSEERFLAWQLASLVPYRDAPQPEAQEPGRRSPNPIAVNVAKEGIKATNKVCDVINASLRNQTEISTCVYKLYTQKRRPDKKVHGEDAIARDVLGMAIRRWGPSWRSQALYSMLVEIADSNDQVESIERRYATFVEHLCELEILDAFALKPLLDGKMLAKALNTPPGPWMKDALDVVMGWQLRHPGVTDSQQAIEEVKNHQTNGELASGLMHHFLKLTIRPLFLKAGPSSVTEQGRKVLSDGLPKKFTAENMDDNVNKPWKSSKDEHALDLLRWVVHRLSQSTMAEMWPLVVPPLLTLIDDWETKYKRIGVDFARQLFLATPPTLLERTGLGEVFEEALMPCLTYLPTVTSEDESILLLPCVYSSLLALAQVRYPNSPEPKTTLPLSSTGLDRRRVQFLDTIIRKGVLYGYSHCSNYPKIISVLFEQLVLLLDELGIDSVKHIKYILPMLTQTLSHSLATASMPMLERGVSALQALIRNCWPRMPAYRGEVLKAASLCWLNLQDVDGRQSVALRRQLIESVKMLHAAVAHSCDFPADCTSLVTADPRLSGLLELDQFSS